MSWRWASARSAVARFLGSDTRQAVPEADLTLLRPKPEPAGLPENGTRAPCLIDEEPSVAAALELALGLLEEIEAGAPACAAAEQAPVRFRDGPRPECPPPEHQPAEDDDPPAGHTTRYSPAVRRFATYRDLYQPD